MLPYSVFQSLGCLFGILFVVFGVDSRLGIVDCKPGRLLNGLEFVL